eukprot:3163556-Pyramimonas_sp.AAC.1
MTSLECFGWLCPELCGQPVAGLGMRLRALLGLIPIRPPPPAPKPHGRCVGQGGGAGGRGGRRPLF